MLLKVLKVQAGEFAGAVGRDAGVGVGLGVLEVGVWLNEELELFLLFYFF